MKIANNTPTAQPLSDGNVLPAGAVADVDDDVGKDALERGAATAVDHSDHAKKDVLDLTAPEEPPVVDLTAPGRPAKPRLEGAP